VFFSTFYITWVIIAVFISMTVSLAIRALWWTLGVRGFSTVILVLRRNSILYTSKFLVAFLISTKKCGNSALSEKRLILCILVTLCSNSARSAEMSSCEVFGWILRITTRSGRIVFGWKV